MWDFEIVKLSSGFDVEIVHRLNMFVHVCLYIGSQNERGNKCEILSEENGKNDKGLDQKLMTERVNVSVGGIFG